MNILRKIFKLYKQQDKVNEDSKGVGGEKVVRNTKKITDKEE